MRASTRLAVFAALCGLIAGGCDSDDGPSYPGPVECVSGTGAFEYQALEAGQEVPIIAGIQGGYHIWGAMLVRYVEPRGATVEWFLELESDGALVERSVSRVNLGPAAAAVAPEVDAGWLQMTGTFAFVPDPGAIDGARVRMRGVLTDVDGRTCESAVVIVARAPQAAPGG